MSGWVITPTNAGLRAAIAANNAGVSLQIAQIALGDANGAGYQPTFLETALRHEFLRINVSGAQRVDDTTFQVECVAQLVGGGTISRDLWEIGVYFSDGTLGFIASRTAAAYLPISNEFATKIAFALKVDRFPANSITINMLPPIADAYVLPVATTSRLGGVKASTTISVDEDGTAHVHLTSEDFPFLRLTGGTLTGSLSVLGTVTRNPGHLGAAANSFLVVGEDYVSDENVDSLQTFAFRQTAGANWDSVAWQIRRIVDGIAQGSLQFQGAQVQLGSNGQFPLRVDTAAYAPTQPSSDYSDRLATTAFAHGLINDLTNLIYTRVAADGRFVHIAGDTMTGPLTVPSVYRSPGALSVAAGSSLLSGQDTVIDNNSDALQTFAHRVAAGGDWMSAAWYFRRIVDGVAQGAIRFLGAQVQIGTDSTFPLRVDTDAYAPTQAASDSSDRLATTAFVHGIANGVLAGKRTIVCEFGHGGCIGGAATLAESVGGTASLNVTFYTPQPDANYEVIAMGFISGVTPSTGGRFPGPVAASLAYKNANGFGFTLANATGDPGAYVTIFSATATRTS